MNYELYGVWAATIWAVVEILKLYLDRSRFGKSRVYARLLPLLPPLVGMVSGALVAGLFGWTPAHGAFFGIGAAGVAASAHAVHKQTIRGRDARLTTEVGHDRDD